MLPALLNAAPGIISAIGGAGGGAPPAPSEASASVYGSGLDGSGWNVNYSGLQTSGPNKAGGEPSALDAVGLGAGGLSPLLIVGAVAIIGLAVWAKSKSRK